MSDVRRCSHGLPTVTPCRACMMSAMNKIDVPSSLPPQGYAPAVTAQGSTNARHPQPPPEGRSMSDVTRFGALGIYECFRFLKPVPGEERRFEPPWTFEAWIKVPVATDGQNMTLPPGWGWMAPGGCDANHRVERLEHFRSCPIPTPISSVCVWLLFGDRNSLIGWSPRKELIDAERVRRANESYHIRMAYLIGCSEEEALETMTLDLAKSRGGSYEPDPLLAEYFAQLDKSRAHDDGFARSVRLNNIERRLRERYGIKPPDVPDEER